MSRSKISGSPSYFMFSSAGLSSNSELNKISLVSPPISCQFARELHVMHLRILLYIN